MKVITDINEFVVFWSEAQKTKSYRYALSKFLPPLYFWNTTGREDAVDFPTIYFTEDVLLKYYE